MMMPGPMELLIVGGLILVPVAALVIVVVTIARGKKD